MVSLFQHDLTLVWYSIILLFCHSVLNLRQGIVENLQFPIRCREPCLLNSCSLHQRRIDDTIRWLCSEEKVLCHYQIRFTYQRIYRSFYKFLIINFPGYLFLTLLVIFMYLCSTYVYLYLRLLVWFKCVHDIAQVPQRAQPSIHNIL